MIDAGERRVRCVARQAVRFQHSELLRSGSTPVDQQLSAVFTVTPLTQCVWGGGGGVSAKAAGGHSSLRLSLCSGINRL